MALQKVKLGSFTVPTSWEEVKLNKWSEYVKYATECKENEEDLDIIKVLEILSDIPRETIMQMPVEMFEKIYQNLAFLEKEVDTEKRASPFITIDGEKYQINFMEKLKVQEYLDVNTTLESNKYDYPMVFAILCRKEGEEYDDKFIADKLNERYKMYENITVEQAFPLIGFFLVLYGKYRILSRNSMEVEGLKEVATELVKHIESSLKVTDFITLSKLKAIMTLSKCKRYLKHI